MSGLVIFIFVIAMIATGIVLFIWRGGAEKINFVKWLGVALVIIGLVVSPLSFTYFQDPGEVAVIRNLGGSLGGYTSEAGIHVRAPWQDVIKYDVRNNIISFIGEAEEDYIGGQAFGPQITINDKGGASADMDVQVQYSLRPDAALTLYTKYGSQENFVRQIVAVGVRAASRDVAGTIETIDILTSRGSFSESLRTRLAEMWEDDGVIVESVSVQDIRYSEAIRSSYAEAQAAEIAVAKAENEQKAAQVEAQTREIAAQGEANANRAIADSLSDEVLKSRYIDALTQLGKDGNVVLLPLGTDPIINLPS